MLGALDADPDKIRQDWAFLLEGLRQVLEEAGETDLARSIVGAMAETALATAAPETTAAPAGPGPAAPSTRAAPGAPAQALADGTSDPTAREHLAQGWSIAFVLLGEAEQNAAVQHRRHTEREQGPEAVPGVWPQALLHLRDRGLTGDRIAAVLPDVRIELVLTAHPTEAKRATVLEHHRRLYLLLAQRDNPLWSPSEQDALRESLLTVLATLWRTGEIFLEKPDIASERRNVLHYLREVFPRTLPVLDRRLRQAWSHAGLDPALLAPDSLPRVTFGTWVGGDRDGHPLVTGDVTATSLAELRDHALALHAERLTALARDLSLSEARQPAPPDLRAWIADTAADLGDEGARAVARNPGEPWRQAVNLMQARLHATARSTPGGYDRAAELRGDLTLLRDALIAGGSARIAAEVVQPVLRGVESTGFHLARLDIRQNSRVHELALNQLLGVPFDTLDEAARTAALDAHLAAPLAEVPGGPELDRVLDSYRPVADAFRQHGGDGLGALIVSMTRSASDLLAVYALARAGGLLTDTPGGPACVLPVVPLFETIDDLDHAPGILGAFLDHPLTRRSLAWRASPGEEPVQQVMIGYSDSNKDGGLIASLWGLYRAQARLAAIGRQRGIRVRFFHGRGGTISRGAGPVHRFVKAQPHDALRGDLRMTEQGETIAQKYANRTAAAHHLELLVAGVTRATLLDRHHPEPEPALGVVMDQLAADSRQAYAALLATPGFVPFFRQATPIDAIEQARIGSRPARRTGQASLADLRAIPWVFSWGQARFNLSGWYGVGTALTALRGRDPRAFDAVSAQLLTWAPLHYILSNAATSVMTADRRWMIAYAAMVEDLALRERLLARILDEYDRTVAQLAAVYGGELAERRPSVHAMMALRQPGLDALHHQQLTLLRRWRAARDAGEAEALLPHLLLTVNAIASGLGSTG